MQHMTLALDAGTPHGLITQVGVIVALLLLGVAVAAVSKRGRLPFTVLLVLAGVGLAQLAAHGPAFLAPFADYRISPDVILFVFLPTLIYESAFNMEARQLRRNLGPVLVLAVPGLLFSTTIIGAIVSALTPIPFPAALVLGAILSATDPVAVISIFRRLGAPKRLTILVEGESLFNDATSIVVAGILLDVAMRGMTGGVALHGVTGFFVVFFGGMAVGVTLAGVCGWLLGRVRRDAFIELTLTTILAYASFLIAEHLLHVSGVMATVMAGLTMGAWGRTKISPAVEVQLHQFWTMLAETANVLIFLLVGLSMDLAVFVGSIGMLTCVAGAMLISRAAVIFGLVPLACRLSDPVDRRYQTVMFWGGLRGAIALAIVLQLPDAFEYKQTFFSLVAGAVLFTLLVQGLTIETLVRRLGLDRPPIADRLARTEGLILAKQNAVARIPGLQAGGHFSPRIAKVLRRRCEDDLNESIAQLETLRSLELDEEQERRLLYLRCFAVEMTAFFDMFRAAHLSEAAYRSLAFEHELAVEAMRFHGRLLDRAAVGGRWRRRQDRFLFVLERFPVGERIARRLRAGGAARQYECAWGRTQAARRALAHLDTMARAEHERTGVVGEVQARYAAWRDEAQRHMDAVAEQFPEFVHAVQELLAERLVVHAQRETIEQETRAGMIPDGVGHALLDQLETELEHQKRQVVGELHVDPSELLRSVSFLRETPPAEFAQLAECLHERTFPSGTIIIRQGERRDSLFLIARGVVRVIRETDGESTDLATLVAGEFFGEMALLNRTPRSATCRAVTVCALYELLREDLDRVSAACPAMMEALREAVRVRT